MTEINKGQCEAIAKNSRKKNSPNFGKRPPQTEGFTWYKHLPKISFRENYPGKRCAIAKSQLLSVKLKKSFS
jgi:hypothetical protein